jgi:putative cofactor-binding repeat protein
MLQEAVDAAARSGLPLFLPPGIYSTRLLELSSGTHITGVPGQSILRCRDGGGLIGIEQAKDIRVESLVFDGDGKEMGVDGALLAATMVARLRLSKCRFLRSGSSGILVSRCEDVAITGNIVEKAATGIAVTNAQGRGRALVQGNLVRNLFFRKVALFHGIGISIDADAVVRGNIVENAPGFGILVGRDLRDVSITHNRISYAHIGIGIPAEIVMTARLAGNMISNAQNGAIRAMQGPAPIGPDLADQRGAAAAAAV